MRENDLTALALRLGLNLIDIVDGLTGEVYDVEEYDTDWIVVDRETSSCGRECIVVVTDREELWLYYANQYSQRNPMTVNEFLGYCTAHGGNWCAMLASGMRRVYPKVYECMERGRSYTFSEICNILEECGVDFEAE